MPRLLRALLLLVVVAGLLAGVWVFVNWRIVVWQWSSYQVGAAASFEEARKQFAQFEQGEHAPERLRVLVAKWGTGNRQFDRYLAQYATDGGSSTALRRAFSRELGRRPELLPRWEHFWRWQASLEPERQIASILEYLDPKAFADQPGAGASITWRELLDLQAIFAISGDHDRAARVRPDTWREHYRVWSETRRTAIGHVSRPASPLPD